MRSSLQGAASFVKKSVFGVSDSITKITGSVGQGILAQLMFCHMLRLDRSFCRDDGLRLPTSAQDEPTSQQAPSCHVSLIVARHF
jgi:hypothetical protein